MSANTINGFSVPERGSGMSSGGGRASRRTTRSGLNHPHGGDTANEDAKSRSKDISQPTIPTGDGKDAMDARRAALLAAKQAQLDKVIDRHDDLVRELFHMENFTMMLSYDPAEAKTDQTAVFREYKSKYDLLDKAAPVAGPSRQTRGRLNERRQILASTVISTPRPSTSPKRKAKSKVSRKAEIMETLASASVASHKGKGKEKENVSEPEPPVPLPAQEFVESTAAVESVTAPVVNRDADGDGIVYVVRKSDKKSTSNKPAVVESISAPVFQANDGDGVVYVSRKSPKKPTTLGRLREQANIRQVIEPQSSIVVDHEQPPGPPPAKRRKTSGQSQPGSTSTLSLNGVSARPVGGVPTNGVNGHAPGPPGSSDDSISVGLQQRRSGRLKAPPPPPQVHVLPPAPLTPKIKLRLSTAERSSQNDPPPVAANTFMSPPALPSQPPPTSVTTQSYISSATSPSKFGLKRIKLIVRRPPPTLTNPDQRPPVPKFNHSLRKFLSSYTMIDEEDVATSRLEEQAKEEARLRERVEKFRREGRVFLDADGLIPQDITNSGPRHISTDIWSHVLESVIERGKAKPKKPLHRQVTSQIASKINAYFDGLEARKNKAREVEERRLRALAKSTMKLVSSEWKKALYHIREKLRQEQEEEERRLGHAHLDAILDQSGQLLETQQGDLSRGDLFGSLSRSRSGSIGDFDEQDEEDDDDEEEEEERDTEEEDEGSQDGDDEGDEEPGIENLISGPPPADGGEGFGDGDRSSLVDLSSSRPRTPDNTESDYPDEDDQDISTAQLLNEEIKDVDGRSETSFGNTAEDMLFSEPETQPEEATQHSTDIDITPRKKTFQVESSAELVQGSQTVEPAEEEERDRATPTMTPEHSVPETLELEYVSRSQSHVTEDRSQSQLGSQQDAATQVLNPQEGVSESQYMASSVDQIDASVADLEKADSGPQAETEEKEVHDEDEAAEEGREVEKAQIPAYLRPFAVAPMEWDSEAKVTPPLLLRGVLRPYQQSGLEWLASLHTNRLNGILADEMGLGKTIQTIALLAHLACDRGIWGPHLIIVPTSVLLNWEMEFKKFLPGFRVLSYHGTTKRRKELRQGWNDKYHFNVCITSYTLASRDAHIFKRKPWYYMILDEAHMIKNFKSQRWNILLMFRSHRRLLLTGTPLQNNLTELWSLLQFLMSGSNFANLKEFAEWFSNPLEKAIEMGNVNDDETLQRVSKLHTVLRPYLLRRLKRDVEKELPSKFEHLTLCPLSKRQRFLYDEFMSRAQTRDALESGVYQKIANILMQLRKVCNHPDLFEVRPIVTSFAMPRSAVADFEIQELLIRRRFLAEEDEGVNLGVVGLRFIEHATTSLWASAVTRSLDATASLPHHGEMLGEPPPKDTRSKAGFLRYTQYAERAKTVARWAHIGYLNKLRCSRMPILPEGLLAVLSRIKAPILPFSHLDTRFNYLENVDRVNKMVKSYSYRAQEMSPLINHFAFATPPAVALDLPRLALAGYHDTILRQPIDFDNTLHFASVKLQIAFPDPSLLQYDCGKLQKLADLLREKKAGGHRVLIFTQMTRILDILEIFLNLHGYLYLRLDGATKIEDRQYITERFNADPRIFCFIASSRSGGVGINLTGADTVVFYDSDFNPQMDKQCEDRAHRIGQIRDVHIYRFVSQYTVEEAMLRKANQKRSLDDLVIQKGEFDWRTLFSDESSGALTKALGDFEDAEDRHAAAVAAREEFSLVGADEADFGPEDGPNATRVSTPAAEQEEGDVMGGEGGEGEGGDGEDEEQGGSIADYMLAWVEEDYENFREVKLL